MSELRHRPCDDSELMCFIDKGHSARSPLPPPNSSGAAIDGDEGQSDETRYSLSLAPLVRLASPIDGHRVGGTRESVGVSPACFLLRARAC